MVCLDLYLVIGFLAVFANFPLGRELTPKNMKYSYLVLGTVAQVVVLPVAVLSVFGLTILGATIVSPFAPAKLIGNFSVLVAPIFLLVLVVGSVTREFLRNAEHTYGS